MPKSNKKHSLPKHIWVYRTGDGFLIAVDDVDSTMEGEIVGQYALVEVAQVSVTVETKPVGGRAQRNKEATNETPR